MHWNMTSFSRAFMSKRLAARSFSCFSSASVDCRLASSCCIWRSSYMRCMEEAYSLHLPSELRLAFLQIDALLRVSVRFDVYSHLGRQVLRHLLVVRLQLRDLLEAHLAFLVGLLQELLRGGEFVL